MRKFENDRTYKLFGHFVKTGRERTGLYQREVAALVGLSQGYYSQIESGTRQVSLPLALSICAALELNFNDFVSMTRPAPRRKKETPTG